MYLYSLCTAWYHVGPISEYIMHNACSFAYNRETDDYLTGTTTGVDVWKLTQVQRSAGLDI